jgi:hypothetical protein
VAESTRHEPSQLFTVRVWQERLGDGQVEWRGQIHHVLTGRARYFRGWPALTEQLRILLECAVAPGEKERAADKESYLR